MAVSIQEARLSRWRTQCYGRKSVYLLSYSQTQILRVSRSSYSCNANHRDIIASATALKFVLHDIDNLIISESCKKDYDMFSACFAGTQGIYIVCRFWSVISSAVSLQGLEEMCRQGNHVCDLQGPLARPFTSISQRFKGHKHFSFRFHIRKRQAQCERRI